MTREQLQQFLEDQEVSVLLADGFDDAFIGVDLKSDEPRAVYDEEKCIDILAKDMSHEDAVDYYHFNVAGSYVGPQTPLFIIVPVFRK